VKFSLFFFSGNGGTANPDKYSLLLECARFADEHEFTAVWLPERHFHELGGLYPNPALLAAALAVRTTKVELRAGSQILPINDTLRVAENWAVVDNLSRGRVGLAFGSGWQPNDFAFFPERYPDRKAHMRQAIQQFRELWSGGAVAATSGTREQISVKTFPRPLQRQPPIWLSAMSDQETFRLAATLEANVLTALLHQTLDEAEARIRVYRAAWREARHGSHQGTVTLMLHTFLGDNLADIRALVEEPMREYIARAIGLMSNKLGEHVLGADARTLSETDVHDISMLAARRYMNQNSLIGTVDSCSALLERLVASEVDEVACFVDFGLPERAVLDGLEHLRRLRDRWAQPSAVPSSPAEATDLEERVRKSQTSFARSRRGPRSPST
jgi:natural product biosynthesis luciferase-like monooxygenase protein